MTARFEALPRVERQASSGIGRFAQQHERVAFMMLLVGVPVVLLAAVITIAAVVAAPIALLTGCL